MRISAVTIFTQVVLYHINKDTWKGDRFMIYAAADIEWVGQGNKSLSGSVRCSLTKTDVKFQDITA